MKRGQISFVLILGVVLILAVTLLSLAQSNGSSNSANQEQGIESYIAQTAELALGECIIELGLKGGLLNPSSALKTEFGEVVYAFNEKPIFLSEDELKYIKEVVCRGT